MWALIQYDWCPYKNSGRDTDTHREDSHVKSQTHRGEGHVATWAETGVMYLQVKDCWPMPEGRREA